MHRTSQLLLNIYSFFSRRKKNAELLKNTVLLQQNEVHLEQNEVHLVVETDAVYFLYRPTYSSSGAAGNM